MKVTPASLRDLLGRDEDISTGHSQTTSVSADHGENQDVPQNLPFRTQKGTVPMEGLRLPEQEPVPFSNRPNSKCYSQQDPAGFAVYSTHGVIVGDGFLPEVYNLHRERDLLPTQSTRSSPLCRHTHSAGRKKFRAFHSREGCQRASNSLGTALPTPLSCCCVTKPLQCPDQALLTSPQ